jgi:hypothetical protein
MKDVCENLRWRTIRIGKSGCPSPLAHLQRYRVEEDRIFEVHYKYEKTA